jgi:photosystem II stability/assembly factor-like uncharacterized protein
MSLPTVGSAFAVAIMLLATPAAAGTEAGTPIEMRTVRQNLFGTCFTSDQEAWMVGELGRIFHTADGGTSWQRQDASTKRPFLAISCLGPGHVWAAGKEGIVYESRDSGASWKQSATGSDRHIFSLQFANERRGHGVGDYGTMIHTEDGGDSWTVGRVPNHVVLPEIALDMGVEPGDVNLYGLSYGSPERVWTVGEFGIIMASADGGLTWEQQRGPFESTLFGVHFIDAQRGWAVGIDSVILRTEDGGVTWEVEPPPVRQRSLYDIVIDGQNGWIVGDSGTVLRSSDGGTSWRLHPLPIELAANWIRSVWLTSSGSGLAVGADGLVFRLDGDRFERLTKQPVRREGSS